LYEKRYLRRYNNSANFGDETLQFMRRGIDQIKPTKLEKLYSTRHKNGRDLQAGFCTGANY
jgi:hypothetical protein